MKTNELSPQLYGPFFLMALTVPAAEAALGVDWLPAVVLCLSAVLLVLWMSAQEPVMNRWMSRGRLVTIVLLLGYYLEKSHSCWPGKGAQYAVPAVLMLLAAYSAAKGTGTAIRSTNVLRYGMYAVLALLLYTGVQNIKWEALAMQPRLPSLELGIVMLLPLMGRREGSSKVIPAALLAVAVAVIAAGTGASNLYMYSQGLSIRGITEHGESLTACAVTVGYYALVSYLLDCGIAEQQAMGDKSVWWLPAAGAAGYLLSIMKADIREELYVILILAFWVILPISIDLKSRLKKVKKGVDKRGSK